MLTHLDKLRGYDIEAEDGVVGPVEDFWFDDEHWVVRYVVADTGGWLSGRLVLIAPQEVGQIDHDAGRFPLALRREQIEQGPSLPSDEPVTRQREVELVDFFGWTPYWVPTEGPLGTGVIGPLLGGEETRSEVIAEGRAQPRSVRALTGSAVVAEDGEAGSLSDFLVATEDWSVRFVILETGALLGGHKTLVPPQWIVSIDRDGARVHLRTAVEPIRSAPAYEGAPVDRETERTLAEHYGRPLRPEPSEGEVHE